MIQAVLSEPITITSHNAGVASSPLYPADTGAFARALQSADLSMTTPSGTAGAHQHARGHGSGADQTSLSQQPRHSDDPYNNSLQTPAHTHPSDGAHGQQAGSPGAKSGEPAGGAKERIDNTTDKGDKSEAAKERALEQANEPPHGEEPEGRTRVGTANGPRGADAGDESGKNAEKAGWPFRADTPGDGAPGDGTSGHGIGGDGTGRATEHAGLAAGHEVATTGRSGSGKAGAPAEAASQIGAEEAAAKAARLRHDKAATTEGRETMGRGGDHNGSSATAGKGASEHRVASEAGVETTKTGAAEAGIATSDKTGGRVAAATSAVAGPFGEGDTAHVREGRGGAGSGTGGAADKEAGLASARRQAPGASFGDGNGDGDGNAGKQSGDDGAADRYVRGARARHRAAGAGGKGGESTARSESAGAEAGRVGGGATQTSAGSAAANGVSEAPIEVGLNRGESLTAALERGLTGVSRASDGSGSAGGSASAGGARSAFAGDGGARYSADLGAGILRQAKMLLRRGGGEVRLVLKPEELGSVRIRLQFADNRVEGRIVVENSAVRQAFVDNLGNLSEALGRDGLEVGDLSVAVGGREGEARNDGGDGGGQKGKNSRAAEFESSVPAVAGEYSTDELQLVDLVV